MKTTLTLEIAKQLKGKQVKTIAYGYSGNAPYTHEFIIGSMISQFDYALKRPYPIVDTTKYQQFDNFQQYYLSYMSENQLNELKETLILLNIEGFPVGMLCHKLYSFYFDGNPTFTESDVDRPVYFEINHSTN